MRKLLGFQWNKLVLQESEQIFSTTLPCGGMSFTGNRVDANCFCYYTVQDPCPYSERLGNFTINVYINRLLKSKKQFYRLLSRMFIIWLNI